MATDLVRVEANERVDLADFQFQANDSIFQNTRQATDSLATNPDGTRRLFVISGFEVTNPTAEQVQVARGRAILAQRVAGSVFYGILTTEGEPSRTVDAAVLANGSYGVYVRFEYLDGESAGRAFWNPQGTGSEFSQTVPTRRVANWLMRLELANPGVEWLKLATVVVSGGTISSITDERYFYFEGPIDQAYAANWSTDGLGVGTDRNANRALYGVHDFQTAFAAVRQCLEDIKGRGLARWWDRAIMGMNIGFDANPVANRLAINSSDFYLDNWSGKPTITFNPGYGSRISYYLGEISFLAFDNPAFSVKYDLITSYYATNLQAAVAVGYTAAVPTASRLSAGDANFGLTYSAMTQPKVTFDTGNDFLGFTRSTNTFGFFTNNVARANVVDTGLNVPTSHGLSIGSSAPVANKLHIGDADFELFLDTNKPTIRFNGTGGTVRSLNFDRTNDNLTALFGTKIPLRLTSTISAWHRLANIWITSTDTQDNIANPASATAFATTYTISDLWTFQVNAKFRIRAHFKVIGRAVCTSWTLRMLLGTGVLAQFSFNPASADNLEAWIESEVVIKVTGATGKYDYRSFSGASQSVIVGAARSDQGITIATTIAQTISCTAADDTNNAGDIISLRSLSVDWAN